MSVPAVGARVFVARSDPRSRKNLLGLSGVVVSVQSPLARIELEQRWLSGPIGNRRHKNNLVRIEDLELLDH